MRKWLSLSIAVLFAGVLSACDEQPTNPDANASVHGAAILNASVDLNAVPTTAAGMNGFEAGDDVGTIHVKDDRARQTLTISGEAEGLDVSDAPNYVSLTYDVESSATGFGACEPALGIDSEFDQDKVLSLAQMEIGPPNQTIGFWDVKSDGSAELGPFKMELETKEYIKVERIGTISIRDSRVTGPFGPGSGPDAVVACGTVVIN